jgi:transcriptional regulator with XRE-family HTH domain
MVKAKQPRVSLRDNPILTAERPVIGDRLRKARQASGHTLDSAAAALTERGYQIGKAGVGHWETGKNMPDVHALKRLARIYDTTIDALIWDDAMSPEAIQLGRRFDALAQVRAHDLAAAHENNAPDAVDRLASPNPTRKPKSLKRSVKRVASKKK